MLRLLSYPSWRSTRAARWLASRIHVGGLHAQGALKHLGYGDGPKVRSGTRWRGRGQPFAYTDLPHVTRLVPSVAAFCEAFGIAPSNPVLPPDRSALGPQLVTVGSNERAVQLNDFERQPSTVSGLIWRQEFIFVGAGEQHAAPLILRLNRLPFLDVLLGGPRDHPFDDVYIALGQTGHFGNLNDDLASNLALKKRKCPRGVTDRR